MNAFKTEIVENTWSPTNHGWGNGYVVLPKDHPLFGKDYDYINQFVCVHGGLTLSELTRDGWRVGFDTSHWGDSLMKWPKERVEEETQNLARQLEDVISIYRAIIELQEEQIKEFEEQKQKLRIILG